MKSNVKEIFQKNWIHLLAIALFIAVPSIYFYPHLQGKTLNQDDSNEGYGQSAEVTYFKNNSASDKNIALWTSGLYIGQPAFFAGTAIPQPLSNIDGWLKSIGLVSPVNDFFIFSLAIYMALLSFRVSPLISAFAAIACSLSTNNIVLYQAGHYMKIGSIAYGGFIIAGTYLLAHRKNYLSGLVLYALGFALTINQHHIQMIYYLYMSLILFGLIYAYDFIKQKDYAHFGKVVALVILGSLIGIGSNTTRLWTTYELSEETVRGPNILEPVSSEQIDSKQTSTEASDGLDWDYAMAWSNNTLDVLSGLVPRMVGGSSAERIKSGESYNALRRSGVSMQQDGSYRLPMYWGALVATSGPVYFGAIIVFLFVFGSMVMKGKLKWWLVASTIFTVALSYGKNFELLSRFMFEYVPLYNKFRTPQSILSVTIIFITLLAALGVHSFFNAPEKERKKMLKPFFLSLGIVGGVCAFIAVLGPSLFSFSGANDAVYRQSGLLTFLIEDRKSFMQQDALRSLVYILIAGAIMYVWHLKRIKLPVAIGLLTVFIVGDLWGVNRRYVHPDDYVFSSGSERVEDYYIERDVDKAIFARETSRYDYRVLDLSINTFNTNYATYFHNTIGGYIATKLQRIQDIQDIHFSRLTRPVLDMLNTTYIINQNQELIINDQALGWAWFVEDVQFVETNREEINALSDINPAMTAVVKQDEFSEYLSENIIGEPSVIDEIERVDYQLDYWKYEYSTKEERLAVFSEMWYKPEKGLHAYVNGDRAEFIRVNYMLRGIVVPEGEGVIEFRYEPESYYLGNRITQASALGLILLLMSILGYQIFLAVKRKELT